jgi:hypothetical protein
MASVECDVIPFLECAASGTPGMIATSQFALRQRNG